MIERMLEANGASKFFIKFSWSNDDRTGVSFHRENNVKCFGRSNAVQGIWFCTLLRGDGKSSYRWNNTCSDVKDIQ